MIDEKNLIEKLEMLRFFNQRAERELWQDKQKAVQDIDIENADEILSFAIESLRKREWVPCSERLPEKPEFEKGYIIQSEIIEEPYSAYWNGKKWTDVDNRELSDIVAWMSLPEPYSPKGE